VRDRATITEASLVAMLDGATFDDCGRPSTWKGPI